MKHSHLSWLKVSMLAANFLGALAVSGHADTQLFDVDFKANNNATGLRNPTQTGVAIIGHGADDVWNTFPGVGPGTTLVRSLFDSNNVVTPVDATLVNTGFSYSGTPADNPTFTPYDAVTAPLMEDYVSSQNNGALALTFDHLDSYVGRAFTLVIYGAGAGQYQGDSLSLSGATGGNSASVLTTSAFDRKLSSGSGDAYQTYTGTLTSTDLTITALSYGGTGYTAFNGMQLEFAVPEPSTWVGVTVLCLAGVVLLRRRFTA